MNRKPGSVADNLRLLAVIISPERHLSYKTVAGFLIAVYPHLTGGPPAPKHVLAVLI